MDLSDWVTASVTSPGRPADSSAFTTSSNECSWPPLPSGSLEVWSRIMSGLLVELSR